MNLTLATCIITKSGVPQFFPPYLYIYFISFYFIFREQKDKHCITKFPDVIAQYSLDEFITMFKISRMTVEQLHQCLGQIVVRERVPGLLSEGTGGRPQVPLHQKMLMALWHTIRQEPELDWLTDSMCQLPATFQELSCRSSMTI